MVQRAICEGEEQENGHSHNLRGVRWALDPNTMGVSEGPQARISVSPSTHDLPSWVTRAGLRSAKQAELPRAVELALWQLV